MKSHYRSALIIALGLLLAGRALAQTYTNVLVFTGPPGEGSLPQSTLVQSGNTVYATTTSGGTNGSGVVFSIQTNGQNFTNLYDFTPTDPDTGTNEDGAFCQAPLILSGSTLYGTTTGGGTNADGVVFRVDTNGLNFTNLYTFSATVVGVGGGPYGSNIDGDMPQAGLILVGKTLYGTTPYGGASGNGTVFSIATDGTNFVNLHSFANSPTEGAEPLAGLILSGTTFYGTEYSDDNSEGAVFGLSGVPLSIPAQLTITQLGTNVVLTWPTFETNYTLQATTNLNSPSTWTNLTGQFTVTNPITGKQKFYRLFQ